MVMPERLPPPLSSAPEVPASKASGARFVAATAEFTARPKRRSFSAKYKLQILAETDGAVAFGVDQLMMPSAKASDLRVKSLLPGRVVAIGAGMQAHRRGPG